MTASKSVAFLYNTSTKRHIRREDQSGDSDGEYNVLSSKSNHKPILSPQGKLKMFIIKAYF